MACTKICCDMMASEEIIYNNEIQSETPQWIVLLRQQAP